MTPLEIISIIALVLISAFAVAGIIIAIPFFKLINRARFLAEKLNQNIVPMAEKLNVTITHLNSEINSISELTQSVGSIVEQLEKIIRLARIIITNPIIKLISAGVGVAEGVKKTLSKDKKTGT